MMFPRQAPDTFDEVRTIHAQLLEKGRMAACVVVANKIDLVGERKVSYVQGLQLVRCVLACPIVCCCATLHSWERPRLDKNDQK